MRPQQQTPTDRPKPARQEVEWSLPPTVERRDDAERDGRQHKHLPQLPPLPQRKDYLPIGAVKVLQEKELISEFKWLEVQNQGGL